MGKFIHTLEVDESELEILIGGLRETLQELEVGEFQTRTGFERTEFKQLLDRLVVRRRCTLAGPKVSDYEARRFVAEKFEELLRGHLSREQVDRWASEQIAVWEGASLSDGTWLGLMQLASVSDRGGEDEQYLASERQLEEWASDLMKKAAF